MTMSLTDLVPGGVRTSLNERIVERGLPDTAYAIAGALDLARQELASAPATLQEAPAVVISVVTEHAETAKERGQSAIDSARMQATVAYLGLVERGEKKLVHATAERAVRKQVGLAEDRLAPKVAAAAVRFQQRRKRWQQSHRIQRMQKAGHRTNGAAKRYADRFAAMNAPVLAEESDLN